MYLSRLVAIARDAYFIRGTALRVLSHMGCFMASDNRDNITDNEIDTLDFISEDPRLVQAVEKYAKSQGVDLNDPRVRKYALGMKSHSGDFGGRYQESPVGWRKKE